MLKVGDIVVPINRINKGGGESQFVKTAISEYGTPPYRITSISEDKQWVRFFDRQYGHRIELFVKHQNPIVLDDTLFKME